MKARDGFTSQFGAIAAAAGSAIGLGNIWRFPYVTGENGGGAFLLIYLLAVLIIGIPAMLSELLIGRNTQKNPVGAFKKLKPSQPWYLIGSIGIITAFIILAFYSTIAGWTMHYIYLSITNAFSGKDINQINDIYQNFIKSPTLPIFWQLIFMFLTTIIVLMGIEKGIEKYTKILMPLLFALIILLDIRAITLPHASEGLRFLFKPDFSKITPSVILEAVGQAFFSLSVGMGVLITYGSYIKKDDNLNSVAFEVATFDTLIAILAGIAIFPAVFAFNIQPNAGPGLVFVTLPAIFNKMFGGYIFAILFFILLVIAALTSSISLLEVVVAYFTEEKRWSRKKASIISAMAISFLGIFTTLSFGILSNFKILGKTIFDLFDYISANILLPIGGFFIVIFVGWFMGRHIIRPEITNNGKYPGRFCYAFLWLARIFVPIAIILIFLYKLNIIKL